jgi:hypothetical protein
MIRQHALREAIRAAQSKLVTDADVVINTTKEEKGFELLLRYQPEPAFFLRAKYASGGGVFSLTVSPGTLFEKEESSVQWQALPTSVTQWAVRIDQDLKSRPVFSLLMEQEEALRSLYDQLGDLPDQFFSREEAQTVVERLSDLEVRLLQHLKESGQAESTLPGPAQTIRDDIQQLKERVTVLRKPGWARSLAAKSWGWLRDPGNRGLLKDGAALVKDLLLPPGPPAV